MSAPKDLFDAANHVLDQAYAPYSNFHVGAALRAVDGSIHAGCNVENAAYSLVLCAESGAISSLIASGQQQIVEALVMADSEMLCPPCGACRQRLYELAKDEGVVVHLTTRDQAKYKALTIGELLPFAFGSRNLS